MPTITSANVSQAILKLVAVDILPALVGNLIMGNLVNRFFEPLLGTAGDTVNIPIAPNLVANNILEGGTVQTQNPGLGNAQIVLNTHAEATFSIPVTTSAIAVPNLVAVYGKSAVIALAEKIEADILSLFPLFTFNTPVGASNTPLTESVLDAAETALFNAKIPTDSPVTFVGSAATYSTIRQTSRFTEQRMVDSATGITGGVVGELKGMNIARSQYVQKVSTTTNNLAFARDAIGMAIRRLPPPMPGTGAIAEYAELGNFGMQLVMSYNPQTLANQVTAHVFYGVGILRNQFAVQVTT